MTTHAHLQHMPPCTLANASPKQQELLQAANKSIGFIPNMYARMVLAPDLLAMYQLGYKAVREQSGFSAIEQEVIFLTISHLNGCKYCTAAHSMLADKISLVPSEIWQAINQGLPLADIKLSALHQVISDMVTHNGNVSEDAFKAFERAGYSHDQLLYLIMAIATKTISNFTNHLFATPVDAPFAAYQLDPNSSIK